MTNPYEDFIARYPPGTQGITRALRALIRQVMPEVGEVLVAQQNHIDYRYSAAPSSRFVYVTPMADYVRLGFDYGGRLEDPEALLEGSGKRMRHTKIRTLEAARQPAVERLLGAAWSEAGSRWAG